MRHRSTNIAKISRPKFFGIYPRERLFSLLDKVRRQPVIWVKGPPGAGKTTLASSYIEDQDLHCLWYRFDEGDNDVGSFFYFMGLAAKRAAPRTRKPLPVLTPEYLPGLSTFTRNYFRDLFSRLPTPFLLVFDNYHEILPDSMLHEVIRCGLEEVCEGINIILTSREGPPPKLAALRSRGLMATLGWDVLRLTPDESSSIIALHSQERISKDTVHGIHKRAGGWVAGLVLLIEGTNVRVAESGTFPGKTPAVVFNFLAGEVFDKMDVQSREFLLETSFLRRMTARMAQEMTGINQARSILSHLNRHHYFIDKSADPEPFYQYHTLFQEFLQSRALDTHTPERLEEIRLKGASVLEEFGLVEDAVTLYGKAECWDRVAGLIIKQAPLLIYQGRSLTLQGRLDSLPDDLVNQNPWLLYWTGVCRLSANPLESQIYFENAYELFKTVNDRAGVFLSWAGIVDAVQYAFHDVVVLDYWIEELERLLKEDATYPSPEIEAQVVRCMFTALLFRRPDHPGFDRWEERAGEISLNSEDINIRVQTAYVLAVNRMWKGDCAKAEIWVNRLLNWMKDRHTSPLAQLTALVTKAMFDWLTASPAEALERVNEGIELSQASGVYIWDQMFRCHGVAAALDKKDMKTAGKFLKHLMSVIDYSRRGDVLYTHYLIGLEALLRSDIPRAFHHMDFSRQETLKFGLIEGEGLTSIGLAEVLLAQGKYQKAGAILSQGYESARRMKSDMLQIMALVTETRMAFEQGMEGRGLELLRKTMALGRKAGCLNFFGWRPEVMAGLCLTALEHKIEVEYVQNLIKKRNLIPEDPPVDVEEWPWAVKVYTMGRFDLMVDGRSVRFSKKTPKRPLMLLKAIIALGGHNVGVEQTCDALWPDADGDAAQAAFNMTLSRLRKLVGHEKAVICREGRVSLDPRYCWIDTWALERILDRFDDLSDVREKVDSVFRDSIPKHDPSAGNRTYFGKDSRNTEREKVRPDATPAHALFLTKKAMGLYKGDFLGTEPDYPWILPRSEYLRNRFLRHIGDMGDYLCQVGEHKQAIACYQKGLEMDNLTEGLYLRQMKCYKRRSRRAEAVSVYNRFRKILSATVGVEPSPEITAVYKTLKS